MSDKVEEALDVLGRYTLAGKVVQAAVVVNQEIRRQQAEIERLKAENHLLRNTTSVTELDARVRLADCQRLLRGLVLASECFLSSEVVDETSGTIPLMDRLEKAIKAARAAGGDDESSS